MRRRTGCRRAMSIALSFILAVSMIPELAFSETETVTEENVTKEDVIKKTEDTTTYALSDGKMMEVFHSDDVRFKDENGDLKDFDPSLTAVKREESLSGADLTEYMYENRTGDAKQYLPQILSEQTPVLLEWGEKSIAFSLTEDMLYEYGIEGEVRTEKSEVLTPYDTEEEKTVDAVYEGEKALVTYRSEDRGVKESIELADMPESGTFTYWLDLAGIDPQVDAVGGITFFDADDPEEIVGGISPAYMEDAKGKRCEDVTYDLAQTEEEGLYLLTMKASEEFLAGPETTYPVIIDPSITWRGSSQVKDAYVISGSTYQNTNFYSSSVKKMPAGKNSTGTHRTYIKFTSLASQLSGKYVMGATFAVYDYGEGTKGQTIAVKRVKASWSPSTIKWSNKPANYATMSTIKTTKTKYQKYSFDAKLYAEKVAGGESDYGLVLMNDSAKYVSFYGSRASSYRPKLTVTYAIPPAKPSAVDLSKTNLKDGDSTTLSYSFASGTELTDVYCEIYRYRDDDWYPEGTDIRIGGSALSGSYVISGLEDGRYKVQVWGEYNSFFGDQKASPEFVVDRTRPVTGDAWISTQNHNRLGGAWTDEDTFEINFTGVSDVSPAGDQLTQGSVSYAVAPYDDTRNTQLIPAASEFKTGTVTFSSASPHEGKIVPESADMQLASGHYSVFLKVKDPAGNETVSAMHFKKDKTDPQGNITLRRTDNGAEITGDALQAVTGTVTVVASIDGTGSPLQATEVKLCEPDGAQWTDGTGISGQISKSRSFDLDTTEFENGNYRLKVDLEDQMGHTNDDVHLDIKIANPLKFSEADVAQQAGDLHVTYTFGDNESKLSGMQYKVNDGTWENALQLTSFTGTAGAGSFDIAGLSAGSGTLSLKGTDTAGISTETKEISYLIDEDAPLVHVIDIQRGVIHFTAEDDNFKSWEIKYRQQGQTAYTPMDLTGSRQYHAQDPAEVILNLADLQLQDGVTYEFAVFAEDRAGNAASDSASLTYDEDGLYVRKVSPAFRIKRPGYYSAGDYDALSFVVPSSQASFTLRQTDNPGAALSWYIDGESEGTGNTLSYDCSALTDGTSKSIAAFCTSQGARAYSCYTYENDEVKTESFTADQSKQISAGGKRIVSFTIISDSAQAGITSGGQTQSLQTGTKYYLSDITGHFSEEAITIKASTAGSTVIALDTAEEEVFTVSSLADKTPSAASFRGELNGRTYVYWHNALTDEDEDITYNVYHSSQEDFELNEDTLAQSDIRTGYYCEINQGYGMQYYYAITAVRKDAGGEVIEESPAKRITGYLPDANETTKRLGELDRWGYTDLDAPVGSAKVEESKGNLLYTVIDGSMPEGALEMDLSRGYNSKSTQTGSYGMGWTSSMDLKLMSVYDQNTEDFTDLIFRDGTGAIIRFTQQQDGSYISSEGEYLTLEKEHLEMTNGTGDDAVVYTSDLTMSANDGTKYFFSAGGQILYITEPNGGAVFFDYDPDCGLLKTVETDKGKEITLTYQGETAGGIQLDENDDILLVARTDFPDGTQMAYSYDSEGYLTQAEMTGGNQSIAAHYSYTGSSADEPKNLSAIRYGNGQNYSFTYNDRDKLTKAENPCGEGIKLVYGSGGTTTTTEVTSYFDAGLLHAEKDISSFTGVYDRATGIPESRSFGQGNEQITEEYTYLDGLLAQTRRPAAGYSLQNGSVVRGEETSQAESTSYGQEREALTETSEEGIETTYAYAENTDINDLISEETERDSNNNVIEHMQYSYDADGNVTREEDLVEGRVTLMTYDSEGNLTSETEKKGDTVISAVTYQTNELSGGGRTEISTDVSDGVETKTTTVYDAADRKVGEEVKIDNVTDSFEQYTYDGLGRITSQVNMEDGTTESLSYSYDSQGRVTSESLTTSSGGDSETITTSYTYDACGREVSAVTNYGEAAEHVYTAYSFADAYVFDGEGGSKEIQNAYTVTKTDEQGHVLSQSVTDDKGRTVRTKEDGIYTDICYDKYGTAVASCVYGDSLENTDPQITLAVTDINGNVTDIVRDPVLSGGAYTVGTDSIVTSATYDGQGRVLTNTDGLGNSTGYTYNAKGDLASVTMPDGGRTAYTYSEQKRNGIYENTVTTAHPGGLYSDVTTDEYGNPINITDRYMEDQPTVEVSIEKTYTYENGRCVRETENKGNYKQYTYDTTTGNVSKVSYYDVEELSGGGTSDPFLTYESEYTYDMHGNVKGEKDYEVDGQTRTLLQAKKYTYNRRGLLTSESTASGPDEPAASDFSDHEITYTYDGKGNLTETDYAFRNGNVKGLVYEYDSDDRITRISAKNGLIGTDTVREYIYDSFGRISQVKDYYEFASSGSDCLTREMEYDRLNRLTSMSVTDSADGVTKETYEYEYDKNGKVTSEKTTSRYAAGGSSYTKTFEYDTSGRLTRSTVIDENVYDPQSGDEGITITQYSYDAAGNLEEETSGGIEKSYSHNGFNQLTSAIESEGNDLLSDIDYIYDANGNRIEEDNNTSGETVLMQYNALDMMSRYEKKEGTDTVFLQENRYDGSGKRIEKKEIRERENEAQPGDTSLEKVTKRYTYQGDTVLQTDVSHIDVSGFSGTPQTGATADDTECFNLLTPGGNIVSTSRKHEDNSGEAENWYTFNKDYNGSTTSIISHTGAAVSTYEYDDYGTISAVTDDIDNEVCYTGQIYDEGTGLYYYNARYYDSEGACFTSMDTYRGDNMIPLTLNLYMYCGGDPINYTDPTGHGFLKKLFKKLVKAATKSSSRKASRKTTKKSTHRASATVRRKAVVKRVSSAAKKVKKKVKKGTKKSVKKNKLANTNTYNMYYKSGSKLATGKEASYDSMVNNMTKDPNGFEMAIYTLPIDIVLSGIGVSTTISKSALSGSKYVTIPQKLARNGQTPVIGKMADLNRHGSVIEGEFKVADYLPNKFNAKANWKQNSGVLRSIMQERVPIKDVSPTNAELMRMGQNPGFLGAERNLLHSKGWRYVNGYWYP